MPKIDAVILFGALLAACHASHSDHDAGSDAGDDTDGAVALDLSATAPTDAAMPVDAAIDAAQTNDNDPCHAFTMPSSATLFASDKKVFAHYFYPYPLSIGNAADPTTDYYNENYLEPSGESNKWIANGGLLRARPLPVAAGNAMVYQVDDMKKEIQMAMAAGITGFTIDILGTDQAVAGSQLANLLTAATAVDSRFKIVVMPDITALGEDAASIEAVIKFTAASPAACRLADKSLVFSAFDAALKADSVSFWTGVIADLKTAGITTSFVPTFLGWAGNAAAYAPIAYGFGDWGTATPASAMGQMGDPAKAHAYDRIYMMPVDPQQYRPKDWSYWEAGNSATFRDAWTSAIAGGSDWVQLVTWSDFSESSVVEPYTDRTLAGTIGTGFYDLNAYYAAWFLTGKAPTITHDVLFYFYRRERTDAPAPAQSTPTTLASGGGTAVNDIEVVGFLAAPGTLSITINGKTTTQDAPAGITSFSVPMAAGTPHFAVTRGGSDVISFDGGVVIAGASGLDGGTLDLTYWSGSASTSGVCTLSVP